MSADNNHTPEDFEAFSLEVGELRAQVMAVFRGKQQGLCLAVCLQIIGEQIQDGRMPDNTLEFIHQNLISLHDLVHTLKGLRQFQSAVMEAAEEEVPTPTPPPPAGPTLH